MQSITIEIKLNTKSQLSPKWYPQFLCCLHSLLETYDIPTKHIFEMRLYSSVNTSCDHIFGGKLVGLEFPERGSEINKNGKAGKKE